MGSKEEVAAGRKGSCVAWGSTSRNAGLARAPAPHPAKWSNTNTGTKSSENVDRWAVGCNLVVLKMTCARNQAAKFKHTF
jgi:hypothetical protein